MASENRVKHLEMIQGVVNRLSTNSFLLKGWSVVLISALFALSASNSNSKFIFLAYLPAFTFWGLDGFYLREERIFRQLYDHVRTLDEDKIDFAMDAKAFRNFGRRNWAAACFSITLVPFHGVLIGAIATIMAVVLRGGK